jgi:RND family efflux transporter MFP subunit
MIDEIPTGASISGPASHPLFALGVDVTLEGTRTGGTILGAVLRGARGEALLAPRDVIALFQICGVLRRRSPFAPPPDEIARLSQRLTSEGFVVPLERPLGAVGPDHHVALVEGTEIRPTLYEARDVKTRLGFVGAFDAVLLEGSDSQTSVPGLCQLAQSYGFSVTPAEVQQRLAHLHTVRLLETAVPAPRRQANLSLHPEAFVADGRANRVRYLLSTDEADALLRCQTPRIVGELLSELAADAPDQAQWLQAVIVKAFGLGIVTVTPDPRAMQATAPGSRHNVRPVYEEDDEATRMDALADLELGGDTNLERQLAQTSAHGEVRVPAPAPAPQMPAHHAPYGHPPSAPMTPQGQQMMQPQHMLPPHLTPPPQMMRTTPAHGYAQQQMAPAPHMMTPPPGMVPPQHMTPAHAFPAVERPSGAMGAPRSGAFPTPPPSGAYPQSGMYPTPVPTQSAAFMSPVGPPSNAYPAQPHSQTGVDPVTNSKLASLAGLSLDKGNPGVVTSSVHRSSGGSKLPWVLLVLALGGGGYYIYSQRGKASTTASQPVDKGSATVPMPTLRSGLTAAGYLAARAPIVLSATSGGRLDKVNVKNGDRIKKGQLLAQLADGGIRAELSREGTRVRDAKRTVDRIRKLVRAQAATQLELDKAMGALELAQADRGVVAQRLKETQIYSPIDGTVLEVLVPQGQTVSAQAGVLRIADLTVLAAEVNVAEADVLKVFMQQKCDVMTDAKRDKVYAGEVFEVAQQADRARGTVLVKVTVEAGPDSGLRVNTAAQVRFKPAEEPPAGAGSAAPSGSAAPGGSAAPAAGSAAAPSK